jgi:hypothetical protein
LARKGKNRMIAVILTTFLRKKLLYSTVQSILNNWNDDYILLIGDQSYKTNEEKISSEKEFNSFFNKNKIHYYNLPYDCGLSFARNYLVKKANELNCDYCFLVADSQEFIEKYNFNTIIEFLESDKDNGIVGFSCLKNKPDLDWKWDLDLVPAGFIIKKPIRPIIKFKGYEIQPVDVVQNFFLAKTEVLLDIKWDNELKLCEHEDYFWRLKTNTNYKVFFNNTIKYNFIKDRPEEYNQMRRRIYKEYKQKLMKKYNLSGWIRRG